MNKKPRGNSEFLQEGLVIAKRLTSAREKGVRKYPRSFHTGGRRRNAKLHFDFNKPPTDRATVPRIQSRRENSPSNQQEHRKKISFLFESLIQTVSFVVGSEECVGNTGTRRPEGQAPEKKRSERSGNVETAPELEQTQRHKWHCH